MILTVKVNNNQVFKLVRFDAQQFLMNRELYIQGTDFGAVKNAFNNI